MAAADAFSLIDPELRAAALMMRETMARFSPMSIEKLAERRAWIASMGGQVLDGVPFEERLVPGMPSQPDVVVYVVNARPGEARPAILHIHGGGFTASTAMGSLPNVQQLAADLDCVVVSVDYRLAPETIYRDSVEDSYAALVWTHRNAEALGVDPARIALLGESAGGGHAALVAALARDRGEAPILLQVLIYPMLDDRTGSSRAVPDHIGAFGWNAEANRFGWGCFLGQKAGEQQAPPGSVPARLEDLSGLPPTFIGVGALDLFVDECLVYARRLIAAGVPTELVVAPGAFHGFDTFVKEARVSRTFTAAKLAAFRKAFA
jgi:acetyl esterase/lipase